MAKGNGSWLIRSYNFVGRDPECDRFQTLYQKEHIKEDDLAALAGLATATVKNLFEGKTRKPQHATFAKMASAMGYTYGLMRDLTPNYETEIPKAKAERKQYRQYLKKKRARAERREK
jgi:transcriptional regulator with XRE-family HTH domain